MSIKKPPRTANRPRHPEAIQPTFRSGAVARMARMPAPTLRIWEQRYRAVGPVTAPSGHRLYSAADVQRVLLLRQLTGQGHAIGSIAALDAAQLQEVASTHVASIAGKSVRPARPVAALRLVVVGQALALRLQRPAVVQRLAHPWQVTAVFASLAEAVAAAAVAEPESAPSGGDGDLLPKADLLLWQAPGLHASELPGLQAAQAAWRARQVAVTYRFAGAAAESAFAATRALVVREPPDDHALGAWVAALQDSLTREDAAPSGQPVPQLKRAAADLANGVVKPRRFDDAALTAIAHLPLEIACECPRHVAEMLIQLSNFEAYSADCANRSPADAQLHAYLQQVAGVSRGLFEAALERLARQEGFALP
jgi:MerR family transcriptional regulator, light-induced transcriptional regulator